MRLLVIGHSVVDKIENKNGSIEIKPGGIFYSIAALNSVCKKDDEIYLCTEIDSNYRHLFENEYKKVNQSFVTTADKTPIVTLKIYPGKERDEFYDSIPGNLQIPIKEINSFDHILINMISGFDISLSQIKEIRNNFDGLIYFDVHTFSRGINHDMRREFRQIPDFDQWMKCIDILQANEKELLTLGNFEDELSVAKHLIGNKNKILIITKENHGAKIYYYNDEVNAEYISSEKVEVTNKVGLGDSFGSAFFYNYISTKDKSKSLRFANYIAGKAASGTLT